MKILLLSDIHSNIQALQAVLHVEGNVDLLVCAGDLVDYGISPAQIVDYFRTYSGELKLVQGNHDAHVVSVFYDESWKTVSGDENKWVHHNCRLLSESNIEFLNVLPKQSVFFADNWWYLLTHQYDDRYRIIECKKQFEDFWRCFTPEEIWDYPKRRVIFGHTHRQCQCILNNGIEWLNPGSLSYRRPDDPDKHAHYMVIQDGMVTCKQEPYDRSIQFALAAEYHKKKTMMETEIQDFYFFFGDASTSR